MTVTNTVSIIQYVGNASNTSFTYTFRILQEDDLEVFLTDTNGVVTLQVLTTNYTVTGVGNPNGNVVFVVAPPLNHRITIRRSMNIEQLTTYPALGKFPASSHELGLDRNAIVLQQIQEITDRCLRAPAAEDQSLLTNLEIPSLVSQAGKFLRIRTDESGFEYATIAGVSGAAGIGSLDGVSNDGANIDLIEGSNITITSDDGANTITITAAASGILSVDGVSNANGNVDFVAGTGLAITPNDGLNSIAFDVQAPKTIDGVRNDGGNIDLIGGTLVTVVPDDGANTITFNTTAELNTASSIGGEKEVFKGKTGSDFAFRTLKAGTNITLTQNTNDILIDASAAGEANTASNVGAGAGNVFKQKTAVDLEFKTILAGSNITVVNNTNDVTISASGSAGETNTASNLAATGVHADVFKSKVGVDLQFRPIKQGTGMTVTENALDITISTAASVVFSVKDAGAVGDGTTDDTAAIGTAIDSALAAVNGGVVYFPRGTYRTTSLITKTVDGKTDSLVFRGDGQGVSRIKSDHAGGFIDLTVDSGSATQATSITFRDLSILTTAAGGASNIGVLIDVTVGAQNSSPNKYFQNCTFTGDFGVGSAFWLWAIDLDDAVFVDIENVQIRGTSQTGNGIRFKGTGNPTNAWIRNFRITDVDIGIKIQDTAEGIHISDGLLLNCNTGVRADMTAGEPLMNCQNLDMDTHVVGIYYTNVLDAYITNCHIFKNGSSSTAYNAIQIDGSSARDGQIHHNIFETLPGATGGSNFLNIGGSANRYFLDNNMCKDPGASGDITNGILFGASTTNCISKFDEITNATTEFTDSGTGNTRLLSSNLGLFKGAMVILQNDFSIDSTVQTVIVWDKEIYDTSSFFDTSTTETKKIFTIPATGVSRIRVKAMVRHEANNAGTRSCNIQKALVGFDGSGNASHRAAASGSTNCYGESAVIDVSGGDTFNVTATQDSGSAKNLLGESIPGRGRCYFSIEVIE